MMRRLTLTEVFANQKRVNVCEHTVKLASSDSFELEPPGDGGKRERRYLRLIPELCLEDKMI